MIRIFIETDIFKSLLDQEPYRLLETKIKNELLIAPDKGKMIKGTGGIRKIRIAGENRGKSGSYRVLYLDLPDENIIYLLFLYKKDEVENISSTHRKILYRLVQGIKNEFKKSNNQ